MTGFLLAGGCDAAGAGAGEEMDKPAKSAKSKLLAGAATGAEPKEGLGLEIKENPVVAEGLTVGTCGTCAGGRAEVGRADMNANAELLVTGAGPAAKSV